MQSMISYQFDEAPVRVMMLADEPWFVANDLCAALSLRNSRDALSKLDDDEKGVGLTDTLGGKQELNIVSESGMYALILRSRKPEARRFRKWVTSEVLPAIRRTGRYQLVELAQPIDLDPARLAVGVSVVREARRLFGPRAARGLWQQVGLPACIADSEAVFDGDPLASPLKAWLDEKAECTIQQAAEALGIADPTNSERYRIGQLLRLWGWKPHKRKVAKHRTANVFTRPATAQSEGEDA
jgi:hypothetical protein